jgi:hypothetical protein
MHTEQKTVHWTQLQGNKFNKALHPAMLSEHGYRTTTKNSLVGDSKKNPQFLIVLYDRDYVIGWLSSRVVKPLQNEGSDNIKNFVEEAWKYLHQPRSFSSVAYTDEDE